MSDCARVGHGLRPATLVLRTRNAVLRPDFHRHANDVVALFAQKIAGHAGVDSTAHAKEHTLRGWLHQNAELRLSPQRVNALKPKSQTPMTKENPSSNIQTATARFASLVIGVSLGF